MKEYYPIILGLLIGSVIAFGFHMLFNYILNYGIIRNIIIITWNDLWNYINFIFKRYKL